MKRLVNGMFSSIADAALTISNMAAEDEDTEVDSDPLTENSTTSGNRFPPTNIDKTSG